MSKTVGNFKNDVDSGIQTSQDNGVAYQNAVDELVKAEIDHRKSLLLAGKNLHDGLVQEHFKIKETKLGQDNSGNPVTYWKDEDLKRRKQIDDRLQSLEKAFAKAVNDGDYQKLKEIVKKGSNA